MAPVRLRHPKGVATINVPFDSDTYTVQDLQQEIYAASQILPSRQSLKTGYPPRHLDLVPELPVSSLGLKGGDQLIVGEEAEPASRSNSAAKVDHKPPAPVAASSPPSSASSNGPVHVTTSDGSVLVHRVVPDDNSCLFASVALIFEQDMSKAQKMRQIVAEGIKKDPVTYNEAILGMPPSKYIDTILKPLTWGGAIELTILAAHYRTEICSVDVETGRIDQFTPGTDGGIGGMRCIVVYSGIHYDAATLAPMVDAPADWHQTMFPITSTDTSDSILVAAKKLADILRSKKAYTNTATFDLKCEVCGKGLKGENEARAHAEQTGHTRFGEY
ncbi:hypothetical protein GYMLUDRAFT_45846 [Collybiopsis luxurians FD-317 M1]|uniref:Ubiquitin thioesterase OTU n=1 Tax=Collybiopsis luxurians FD-317 M1 TaxID=944289 RepID=A0A0D0BR36_9AGAR|nr:hypothetical protein GYMLUDRAFT_45846 [Collybiopsis luxurians FD-317 M1]